MRFGFVAGLLEEVAGVGGYSLDRFLLTVYYLPLELPSQGIMAQRAGLT